MEIKIAVCDDEILCLKQISDYLSQIETETGDKFSVFYFSSGDQLIDTMPRDIKIVLLDIKLSMITGIDVAKRLRTEGLDFFLFFITGNVQYALEGYEVHAYAFLQKPLQYAPFKMYLTEVIDKLKSRRPFMLQLKSGSQAEILDSNSILYAEVYGHTTYIISAEGRNEYIVSLSELEEKLKGHGFFRCHKSYLVNLKMVKGIKSSEIEMKNGDMVPLSKYRRSDFLSELGTVLG